MCCFLTTLFMLGPRAVVLFWWLINPLRFDLAFNGFIWPFLGLVFAPWTTLMYVLVWSPVTGVYGFDWVWLAFAFLADLGSYAGSGYGNRQRIPGYAP
jgi:hypothetical protein